jgi:polysaccharide export outer membrane protein
MHGVQRELPAAGEGIGIADRRERGLKNLHMKSAAAASFRIFGLNDRRRSLFRVMLCSALGLSLLAGCASPYSASETLPSGNDAYTQMNAVAEKAQSEPYRISPDDELKIDVFFEPELSVASAKVDRAGDLTVPGIGPLKAEGKTSVELAAEIADSFRGRLLRDPKVTVSIINSSRQKVVVGGQVNRPGVYDVRRDTTLIEALALAAGETEIAKLESVVVYRTIDGQRMAAVFDAGAIMSGRSPDIPILSNDMVIVGYSANRAFWRNVRQAAPIFTVFRPLLD